MEPGGSIQRKRDLFKQIEMIWKQTCYARSKFEHSYKIVSDAAANAMSGDRSPESCQCELIYRHAESRGHPDEVIDLINKMVVSVASAHSATYVIPNSGHGWTERAYSVTLEVERLRHMLGCLSQMVEAWARAMQDVYEAGLVRVPPIVSQAE